MTCIFLSHSSADKAIARRLHQALTRAGVRAWLDEREIRAGDDIPESIERGIAQSDYVAVLLSPRSVRSRWVREELSASQVEHIAGRKHLLPLLIEDCDIPLLLRAKKYVDFRRDFSEGVSELLLAIGARELPPIEEVSQEQLLQSLSLVWDSRGKYRHAPWKQLKREAEETRAGLSILVEDLLEMVEYTSALFEDKTWVLREAVRELLNGVVEEDAGFLARIVITAWSEHQDNIGAAWLLVLMPKQMASRVLSKAYELAPGTAEWLMKTLYDFVVDPQAKPLVFEADLIKEAGTLPNELTRITCPNRYQAAANNDRLTPASTGRPASPSAR